LEENRKDSNDYRESWEKLKSCDGILVPGGFGDRGIEGKVAGKQWWYIN